jgi:hypothetical protein
VTVTLSFDNTLARVRVSATGLGSAVSARVERSLNQVVWTTVRGGSDVSVSAGTMPAIDDYEFIDGVPNYYRVTYANTASFVATGAAAHAANAAVSPTIPTGSTTGDLMLVLAATRSSGQGVPTTPTDYTTLLDAANVKLFGKIHDGSEANPSVSFTGTGGATMSVSAQMATFRNAQLAIVDATGVLNATAQNIAIPDLTITTDNAVVLTFAWKQDDWTSVTSSFGTLMAASSTTLGDDQGICWARQIQSARSNVTAASFTVTGGATAVSRGLAVSIPATTASQQSSITPSLDGVWLKSLGRPFLNRKLDCVPNPTQITRESANIITPVVGRSLPIGISAVRKSRQVTVDLVFASPDDRTLVNVIIGTGDPLYLQTPYQHPLPTMYVTVLNSTETRPVLDRRCHDDWRQFTLPLREIAAPSDAIVGSLSTWQTVIDTYATWNAVLAAKASWFALTELVGDVSEVVVP